MFFPSTPVFCLSHPCLLFCLPFFLLTNLAYHSVNRFCPYVVSFTSYMSSPSLRLIYLNNAISHSSLFFFCFVLFCFVLFCFFFCLFCFVLFCFWWLNFKFVSKWNFQHLSFHHSLGWFKFALHIFLNAHPYNNTENGNIDQHNKTC